LKPLTIPSSFLTFHPIIYDHKDYNVDLNSDIPGVITRIRPPLILLCCMVTRLCTCEVYWLVSGVRRIRISAFEYTQAVENS
jgi:hypothetical protein